jgi:hypothetical protein
LLELEEIDDELEIIKAELPLLQSERSWPG